MATPRRPPRLAANPERLAGRNVIVTENATITPSAATPPNPRRMPILDPNSEAKPIAVVALVSKHANVTLAVARVAASRVSLTPVASAPVLARPRFLEVSGDQVDRITNSNDDD